LKEENGVGRGVPQNLDRSSALVTVTGSHVDMYTSEVTLISIEKDSMMCCQVVSAYDEN